MVKIFRNMDRKDWQRALLCVFLVAGQVWLDLKLPDYMSEITLLVQTPGSEMSDILVQGGYMLLCALASLVFTIIVGFFAAQIAASFSRKLRGMVFDKTMSFSMEEMNGFSTSSLITRSTNDITQIQFVVAFGLQAMIRAPIMVVWAAIKISSKSWQWTMVTAFAVVFLIAVLLVLYFFAMPRFKKIQSLTDNLNRVTRENLTGLRVVRAYNAEEYQEKKFEDANEELTSNSLVANRVMALMMPSMNLVMTGMTLAIYWTGAFIINAADMADKLAIFSNMVTFTQYAMQIIMSFMMLAMIFVMLPRAAVSANRINEVLHKNVRIKDGKGAKPADKKGTVEMRNVSFRYPDGGEHVLRNISFTVNRGETVAFIGSTGSGKSTLINLIPRFYDVSEGQVLVDGVDVREYTQSQLRSKLGYVSQKATLFSGTIASNINFGANADETNSEEKTQMAADVAQAAEFVNALDEKFEAHVAQGGSNFSGGQKQRISIARAVAKKPEIYIFDDSFSALDYKTDRMLRSALAKQTGEVTKLIVAQRIGTIKDADKIVVLDEGQIVGIGSHEQLLNSCEIYKEIALSQLSKEELGA